MTWLIIIGICLIVWVISGICIGKYEENWGSGVVSGFIIAFCSFFLIMMGSFIASACDKGYEYQDTLAYLEMIDDKTFVICSDGVYSAYYITPTGIPKFIEVSDAKIYTEVEGELPMVIITEYRKHWWFEHLEAQEEDKIARYEYSFYLPNGDCIAYRGE